MSPDELIGELASKHGIKISAKDPVLVVAFLNDLILGEQLARAADLMDTRALAFSRELEGHRQAIADELNKVLGGADGELGRKLATAIGGSLDVASKAARDKLQAAMESGRDQAAAAMAHLLRDAQQAAQDAAHARLWAICCAGIALVVAAGLLVYSFIPALARGL